MTRWYRAYEGTVTDPKLAEAAAVAACSRSVAVAAWHLTLENAATVNDGGRIDIPTRRIAAALCEPLAIVETLVAAFEAIGLIADSHVVAWNTRQYIADKSTPRVQKHRAKKTAEKLPRSGGETDETVSETDHRQRQRTDSSEANASGAEAAPKLSASDVTKAIFDTGVSLLTDAGHDTRQARSLIGRWRKDYSDSEVLSVLSRCQASEPVQWIPKALQSQRAKTTGTANGHRVDNDELRNPYARAVVARQSAKPADEWAESGSWP